MAPNGGQLLQIIRDIDVGYLTGPEPKAIWGGIKQTGMGRTPFRSLLQITSCLFRK
jgi:hypothetical protein